MTRVLAIVALASFLVSVVTLSIAVALTGPQAILNGAWSFGKDGWGWHEHHRRHEDRWGVMGPELTREIPWSGDDRLEIDLPAEVQYTQAEGPAKITVTGPAPLVGEVRMEGGRIAFADTFDGWREHSRVRLVVSAPSVKDFEIESAARVSIAGYRQDRLSVSIPGSGEVTATGEANEGEVHISGSGHADLGALKTRTARVEISGSGEARIAPSDTAEVEITGSGEAVLMTNPPHVRSHVSGSGVVRRGD